MINKLIFFIENTFFIAIILLMMYFTNLATGIFTMIVLLLMIINLYIFCRVDGNKVLKVYKTAFFLNLSYAVLCYIYMVFHNYTYLLVFDTHNVIMPLLEDLLQSGGIQNGIKVIWTNYDFFNRFQVGYYSYLLIWGHIAKTIGADLYFIIQLAHLTFCSFIPVLIYRLLRNYNMDESSSYNYSIAIGALSVLFYYCTTIIRDGMITVLFLYMFLFITKKPSLQNILRIAISVYLISTLRIESGLASMMFLPAYYFIHIRQSRNTIFWGGILAIIFVYSFSVFSQFAEEVNEVYENNYNAYIADVSSKESVMGALQRLPPVIREIFSILFNALLPLPCWTRLIDYGSFDRPECFNIMNFPTVIAAFFNLYIIVYLIASFWEKKNKSKFSIHSLKILLIFGIVFIALQSAVVAQRRIMCIYALFYILWALYHYHNRAIYNRNILKLSVVIFVFLQIVTILR